MAPRPDPRPAQDLPAEQPEDLPDMTGRTVVVTGASAGIGAAAARRLQRLGATVVPVGRSATKTAAVAAELGVSPELVDFADLSSVRRLADRLLSRLDRIDVLLTTPVAPGRRRRTTTDGHEMTFQVNHLAPFLLTGLLRERLERSAARVVTTSSGSAGSTWPTSTAVGGTRPCGSTGPRSWRTCCSPASWPGSRWAPG